MSRQATLSRKIPRSAVWIAVFVGLAITVIAVPNYYSSPNAPRLARLKTEFKRLATGPIDPATLMTDEFDPQGRPLSYDAKLGRVWSFGPDRTDDGGLMEYDPTNGAKSRGDIVYVAEPGQVFVVAK